jgi:hypothetical protein
MAKLTDTWNTIAEQSVNFCQMLGSFRASIDGSLGLGDRPGVA